MPPAPQKKPSRRGKLSRSRIIIVARNLADREGLDALSMRKIAQELGVKAMSLYNHVQSKDDLLGGLLEDVMQQMALPSYQIHWKESMRQRGYSAVEVLGRHPWATHLLDTSLEPGPHTLRYNDTVVGVLRQAGFSLKLVGHATFLLDSYTYGFVIQKKNLPFDTTDEAVTFVNQLMPHFPADAYPNLAAMIESYTRNRDHEFGIEFEFGLNLVLDGLERLLG